MSKISLVKLKKYTALPFVILIILLFFILIISLPFNNRIYPNVFVSGIYIGDMTKSDAEKKLAEEFYLADKVTLDINNTKNSILTSEIVTSTRYKETIDRVYNYTNSGDFILDTNNKIKLLLKPRNFSTILEINNEKLLETLLIFANTKGAEPIYPFAYSENETILINPGKDGMAINIDKARDDIGQVLSFRKNEEIKIDTEQIKVSLNDNEVKNFRARAEKLQAKKIEITSKENKIEMDDSTLLSFVSPTEYYDNKIEFEIDKISKSTNRNPQDSTFIVENEKVIEFTPSKDGIIVEEKILLEKIHSSLNTLLNSNETSISFDLPLITTSPKIKNENVNNLGIKSLLGTGFSNFKGSIPNRIHNVNLAQSKFKGVLIPPGEIVSFNKIIGDISAYTGYKSAYVIMDGKTVLGDGGGVCQVSTTLFRAVLNTGLPIIERRAHAYRVGYYEQGFGPGLDATVYSPTTDFKFKNDTEAYLLLQPTIDLNNLTLKFEIYGTDDGRISTVSKPIVHSSIAPAEDQYVDDPTMHLGQVKQIENKAYGAKVTFDYKVERNNEVLIDQKFVSNYRPWAAVFLRGVAQ